MNRTRVCLLIIFNLIPGFYYQEIQLNDSAVLLKLNNDSSNIYDSSMGKDYFDRKKRFLFLFPFYRILPGNPCTTTDNLRGICVSQRQCNARGGICSGSCSGKGVCCVFRRSCGQSTNANITYFTNPNFSSVNDGAGTGDCTLTINKINTGICQLRLDFMVFNIGEPNDVSGLCTDTFTFSPTLPVICGTNSQPGQHVYIDLNPSTNSHTLNINTLRSVTYDRRWNIQISQIACNSSNRAPFGCLKYYTGVQGSDYSFNYSPALPTSITSGGQSGFGNRLIASLNYGVCVRPEAGYCSIKWSQVAPSSTSQSSVSTFSISGDARSSAATMFATKFGADCTINYIVSPNSAITIGTVTTNTDRFCGTAGTTLSTIQSSSRPFLLNVVTDQPVSGNSNENTENRGFYLNYVQNQC